MLEQWHRLHTIASGGKITFFRTFKGYWHDGLQCLCSSAKENLVHRLYQVVERLLGVLCDIKWVATNCNRCWGETPYTILPLALIAC
jgi:hypothetical protein